MADPAPRLMGKSTGPPSISSTQEINSQKRAAKIRRKPGAEVCVIKQKAGIYSAALVAVSLCSAFESVLFITEGLNPAINPWQAPRQTKRTNRVHTHFFYD
jgi:hypothetical protein